MHGMKSYSVLKKLPASAKKNRFAQSQHEIWIRRPRTKQESMMSVAPSKVPIPSAQKNSLETHRSVTANHNPVKTVQRGVYDQLRIDWPQRFQSISLDSTRKSRLQKEVQIETTTEVTHSEWIGHFTNLKADKHAFLTKFVGT